MHLLSMVFTDEQGLEGVLLRKVYGWKMVGPLTFWTHLCRIIFNRKRKIFALGMLHDYQIFIDEAAAQRIREVYNYEWN